MGGGKKEVSMEGARPPVPWKAKRRHAEVIPDNLVQSRLFNFVSKFPNFKVMGGNTNISAENIHPNIIQNTHSLKESGCGDVLVVEVESGSLRIIKLAGN